MSAYTAHILWQRGDQDFLDKRYSRKHLLQFDGGVEIAGSSSPKVVLPPLSEEAAVDPEEAFVASISSCHMLFFLAFASKFRFRVDQYSDRAEGLLEKNEAGKMVMTVVTLKPEVTFSGEKLPTRGDIEHLHHLAHQECYIANSVKSDVRVEPVFGESFSAQS